MEPWEYWGISEEDWDAGWRRTLRDAIEAEFDGKPTHDVAQADSEFEIRIFARKRRDNPIHDYRVGT